MKNTIEATVGCRFFPRGCVGQGPAVQEPRTSAKAPTEGETQRSGELCWVKPGLSLVYGLPIHSPHPLGNNSVKICL